MQKIAKNCRKLQKIAGSCRKLQKVAGNCRKMAEKVAVYSKQAVFKTACRIGFLN